MAIAGEAFELLGDRDDVALLEVVRAGLAHENAKTASVPFGDLFDEFLAAKAACNPKYLKELRLARALPLLRQDSGRRRPTKSVEQNPRPNACRLAQRQYAVFARGL